MKKIVIISLLCGLVMASCNGTGQNKQDATAEKSATKKPVHLSKSDFLAKVADYETHPDEWQYLGDKPALIDFYADWCGPCKAIAPILEELAEEYKDKIYIYKIDTDEEEELAAAFGIQSIPSLVFIPMGEEPQMSEGSMSKSDLKEAIDSFLLKNK